MKATLVVTDLGRMKVYRVTRDDLQPDASPAFQDVAEVDLANRHSRVSDRMADKAGRFSYGPGSRAVGERHSEQEQAEAVQLESIAEAIRHELGGGDDIYLAAPKGMISSLVSSFDSSIQARIRKSLPLNLVKAPKLELLERFGIE